MYVCIYIHPYIVVHSKTGIFFSTREKWVIQPPKAWSNLRSILLSKRSSSKQATHVVLTILLHSRKSQTVKPVGVEGWKDERRAQSLFMAARLFRLILWMINVCRCRLGHNPRNINHQEWSLMSTINFGWPACVNVGSLVTGKASLWWGMLSVGAEDIGQLSKFCPVLLST